jgi:hypothetical protein
MACATTILAAISNRSTGRHWRGIANGADARCGPGLCSTYCTRKLRRLRAAANLQQAKARGKYAPKKVTVDIATSPTYVPPLLS